MCKNVQKILYWTLVWCPPFMITLFNKRRWNKIKLEKVNLTDKELNPGPPITNPTLYPLGHPSTYCLTDIKVHTHMHTS
jgi:hypothetical protein